MIGCAGQPPIDEYTIARTAIEAARFVDAPRFAPGLFGAAEDNYRTAQKAYNDRYHEQARSGFLKAQDLAEKSENATRIKRFQSEGGAL